MEAKMPTCIDCDHAFEIGDSATFVVCSAHLDYRDAAHPATCAHYAPRKMPTESDVTKLAGGGRDS